jgi:cyclomaltodextrin glucanotransferase
MGVTALWLTPLFEQVEALFVEQAAIHGYWTKDFKRINPRFIGKDEEPSLNKTQETRNTTFDKLVTELHVRKMNWCWILCVTTATQISAVRRVNSTTME